MLAVSTYHRSLPLRKHRQRSLHARADDMILGVISTTVTSLTKALVENLISVMTKTRQLRLLEKSLLCSNVFRRKATEQFNE